VAGFVLVVDDDPRFLSLANRILRNAGVRMIASADCAAQAVAAADALRPEGVLMDVGLPDRDGLDLARELAARPWHPQVLLTSTDRSAVVGRIGRSERDALPFVPKEELPTAPLALLLMAGWGTMDR
jgi:DNA-binding response OmpR family regulator